MICNISRKHIPVYFIFIWELKTIWVRNWSGLKNVMAWYFLGNIIYFWESKYITKYKIQVLFLLENIISGTDNSKMSFCYNWVIFLEMSRTRQIWFTDLNFDLCKNTFINQKSWIQFFRILLTVLDLLRAIIKLYLNIYESHCKRVYKTLSIYPF